MLNYDVDKVEDIYFDYEIGCVEEDDILVIFLDNDKTVKIYENNILTILNI